MEGKPQDQTFGLDVLASQIFMFTTDRSSGMCAGQVTRPDSGCSGAGQAGSY